MLLVEYSNREYEIKLALRTFPLIRIVLILKRVRNIYPRAVVRDEGIFLEISSRRNEARKDKKKKIDRSNNKIASRFSNETKFFRSE